jgi:hypothetical protein
VKQGRGAWRLAISAVVVALTGGGCSILVSGDVPEVACSPGSASACPAGSACDPATLRCVSADGSAPEELIDPDGPTADVTEAGDANDASGPQDLGAQCRVDTECKSMLCGASTILTTAITTTTGPICTSPCCTSTECPATFVCFNGGTGGGYCVPAKLAQRTPPATGGKGGGFSCTSNDQCRSGLCTGSPKSCLDTCCVAGDCSGATTCRRIAVASPPPTHDIFACAMSEVTGTNAPGDSCTNSNQCDTNTCIGFGASQVCRPPCSNTESCRGVPGFTTGHCLYGSSGSDYFKFCFVGTTGSDSPAGAGCTDPATCQSDYCDAELKKCANVCAKDSDCAPTEACRPSAVNTPYLRCVKKP